MTQIKLLIRTQYSSAMPLCQGSRGFLSGVILQITTCKNWRGQKPHWCMQLYRIVIRKNRDVVVAPFRNINIADPFWSINGAAAPGLALRVHQPHGRQLRLFRATMHNAGGAVALAACIIPFHCFTDPPVCMQPCLGFSNSWWCMNVNVWRSSKPAKKHWNMIILTTLGWSFHWFVLIRTEEDILVMRTLGHSSRGTLCFCGRMRVN